MATIIREEMFLVDEIEIVYDYTHYNHYNRQSKATSQNTLPQNYQRSADKYNKKTNKHFTKVWNADKREWQTVSVPPYAENIIYSDGEDSEVIDVYDMETGTYKRRGLIKCEICQKEDVRMLYIVRDRKIMRACSFECVESLRRNERAEKEADNIIENAQEKEKENLSAYACRNCGKIPKSIETAMCSITTQGEPEDSTIYMLACGFECALKLKGENYKRKTA